MHLRLADILLIGLCTFLSNGQDYEDMVLFAQTKGPALGDLIDLSRGIPAHDTAPAARLQSCISTS